MLQHPGGVTKRTAIAMLLLAACAPDLRSLNRFRVIGAEFTDGVHVISEDNGDGTHSTQVQASDKTAWIYFDPIAGVEVDEASPDWALAFQRFKVRVRPRGALLDGATLDQVEAVPDGAAWEHDGEGDDLVFNRGDGWYLYDLSNHTLRARERVYLVETPGTGVIAVQMLNYYDATGAGGYPAFQWKVLVSAPAPTGAR